MKEHWKLILSILAIACMIAVGPTVNEEISWVLASNKNTAEGYRLYIKSWPDGRHSSEARNLHSNTFWHETLEENSPDGYEKYIESNNNEERVNEAKVKLESLRWQEASSSNSIQGYERYIQLYGNGKYTQIALDKLERLHWLEATNTNTVEEYLRYIQNHNNGKYHDVAEQQIETLNWIDASNNNTILSYKKYLTLHPNGAHSQEAKALASALRTDNKPFIDADNTGTFASYKQFIRDFPGHQKAALAQNLLTNIVEGRDITDLISEKKIEAITSGGGIDKVRIKIRKLTPKRLTVHIPAGSYFVSSKLSVQNMISMSKMTIGVYNNDWKTIEIPAACSNIARKIPDSANTFTIRRHANHDDLNRIIPFLKYAGNNQGVKQAAIWIITDNASFSQLRAPASRSNDPFSAITTITKLISTYDVAYAMYLLAESGINIKHKIIWNDRAQILKELDSKHDKLISFIRDPDLFMRTAIRKTQRKLIEKGYDPGPVDGYWGKSTEMALLSYRRDRGLPNNGKYMIDDPKSLEAIENSKDILEKNARKKNVLSTSSGLQYKVITKGSGISPGPYDTVVYYWRGTLPNGNEFINSYENNTSVTSQINKLVPGLSEAFQMMKIGGKWEFCLPPNLASTYDLPDSWSIPPYSPVVFELELLKTY